MNHAMVQEALNPSPERTVLRSALEAERKHLWGLCYRMTGVASDADDLVQETFVRAMERPPRDATMELRPWLVRVAMNLARDHLRRRKRRGYVGIWLPSPVETADLVDESAGPETRYGTMESVSFAFLVALEALTPSQRAVLVLRDAFDYSSHETAHALRLSEENVRITLHRARKAMASYDAARVPRSTETTARVDAMLRGVLGLIAAQDIPGAVSLFSERAALLGDGGGVHHAGRSGVRGAEKIVKMYAKLATRAGPDARYDVRSINGVPALVSEDPAPKKPNAPRAVLLIDLDADGRIRTIYSVLSPKKLSAVRFGDA